MKVEISNGDLVDKVSILWIKLQRLSDQSKLANVKREHDLLSAAMGRLGIRADSADYLELVQVNQSLWDTENRIRAKEAARQFDEEFIQLARSVYVSNDRRAAIKRRINEASASALVEEKEYHRYT